MNQRAHMKVLVLGPGEAGKSTLVSRLCANAVNLEVNGRTVALDHGTRDWNGVTFHFIGVPGQERFAPVQEALLGGAAAAVLVMASSTPLDDVSLRWCRQLASEGVPLVAIHNRFGDDDPVPSPVQRLDFITSFTYDLANDDDFVDLLETLKKLQKREHVR